MNLTNNYKNIKKYSKLLISYFLLSGHLWSANVQRDQEEQKNKFLSMLANDPRIDAQMKERLAKVFSGEWARNNAELKAIFEENSDFAAEEKTREKLFEILNFHKRLAEQHYDFPLPQISICEDLDKKISEQLLQQSRSFERICRCRANPESKK